MTIRDLCANKHTYIRYRTDYIASRVSHASLDMRYQGDQPFTLLWRSRHRSRVFKVPF